jgi:alpha-D-ribose 1-methylphosphonate 5-triphosphate synthase subunit PhnG
MNPSSVDLGRRDWMSILALATPDEVEAAWATLPHRPHYRIVRGGEVGLVMVGGRVGGTGARFDFGEMTVTRCTVELENGNVGHAYVRGRERRHAELAAVLDAMLQDAGRRAAIARHVLDPLTAAQAARRRTADTGRPSPVSGAPRSRRRTA